MPVEFVGLPRPDEAAEIIEDLQAKLLRAEDERDVFKQTLVAIARREFKQPDEAAGDAIDLMKARYGR